MKSNPVVFLLVVLFAATFGVAPAEADDRESAAYPNAAYPNVVMADGPIAYWRFEETEGKVSIGRGENGSLDAATAGSATLGLAGPRPSEYPLFAPANRALTLGSGGAFARVADPGPDSPLDFDNGDSITIEAWVKPRSLPNDQQVYIVGKGRTNNPGTDKDNQNYAMRLRGSHGAAHVSFLFRNAKNRAGERNDFHRWNSNLGFAIDDRWHHVAVVYTFGRPESIRGYIDGQETDGTWDFGGPTEKPPVVDDDELWIGSAIGGNASSTLTGQIDEVAIYRKELPAEILKARFKEVRPDPRVVEFERAKDLPRDRIHVSLFEGVHSADPWSPSGPSADAEYTQSSFAFVGFPKKYTKTGVIADRPNPFLLRARSWKRFSDREAGEYEFVLRAKNAARLYLNGKLIVQTAFTNRNASGHELVPDLTETARDGLRLLPAGCQEQFAKVDIAAGEHVFRLESIVGGKGLRLELDELCVGIARQGEPFALLTPGKDTSGISDEQWQTQVAGLTAALRTIDRTNRREAAADWAAYWDRRHAIARDVVASRPSIQVPGVPNDFPVHNEVDHFIGARLLADEVVPASLVDDDAFLRRVCLDTVGVIPSRAEIESFRSDDRYNRRALAIDRLLDDPRWADHWVSYWQDVLAENPGILKPKLNNTGPFRWWIYESLLDNKPMDRFATELVMMDGSQYYGGPAGFAVATQNDVPMAAKAHVLAQAFLGIELKCARCHDAPYHPFKQEQLFNLAAMLNKEPLTLPATSTVPTAPGARKPLVEISLKPGQVIDADWPFAGISSLDFPDGVLQNSTDSRERLAAALTAPHNQRFAKVLVNRLWARLLGRGLVEPVDDWEVDGHEASHPDLLAYLARELVLHDYDLKHVARLVLNSRTYQRQMIAQEAERPELFASPARRRMTAEQLVDSLYVVSGKGLDSESLTLDPEGRRPVESFLNLGMPTRAWQMTSLSNERDRPALALPVAQSIIDILVAYGWRDARPSPVTVRDDTPTVLQPLALANGIVGRRAVRLSNDHAITKLCLQERSLEDLVDQVSLQVLSRQLAKGERDLFVEVLADGYETRIVSPTVKKERKKPARNAVSWSNHLSAEATQIKLELERAVQAGDPPTDRLSADWRERMEDIVWAMLNSPEFVFVP